MALERALEQVVTDRDVELPARDGERQLHATVQPGHECVEQRAVDTVELDLGCAMDALAGPVAQELQRISVRVHGHPRGGLARPVQTLGARRADLDPGPDRSGEIADGDRRLVGIREALRERDALDVLETVGEKARDEILLRLGGMPCDPQRQRLVDATIDVGQLDVDRVDRGVQRQVRPQSGMQAVTVISTSSSGWFSAATVTVVRAGLFAGKYFAYSSL